MSRVHILATGGRIAGATPVDGDGPLNRYNAVSANPGAFGRGVIGDRMDSDAVQDAVYEH
jgi:hypothetical protein